MYIENCIKNKIKNGSLSILFHTGKINNVQTSVFIVNAIETSQESLAGATLCAIKQRGNFSPLASQVKLERAQGGCLGTKSR